MTKVGANQAQSTPQVDPRRQLFAPALGLEPRRGRLEGQTVLVLGAGQRPGGGGAGITMGNGRAMSLLCAREGAAVVCVDRDGAAAAETARLVIEEGGSALALEADGAETGSARHAFEAARRAFGAVSAAIANVGISSGRRISDETADSWDDVMNVNVRAHMLLLKEGLLQMREGGAMLLISSLASVSPLGRNPAYETSKAALAALCRAAALEGQERGIRVNAIAPGLLDTPMGRAASVRTPTRTARPLPFRRQGTAWELAYAALFLISRESSYMNAQTVFLDGGIGSGVGLAPLEA